MSSRDSACGGSQTTSRCSTTCCRLSLLIEVVDPLPAAGQYEFFKNELLNIHQLSDYKKFDMLVKMEPIGGRKPSQLLHAMLEFCPLGMERPPV
jgi:hypothetical protein